MISRPCFCLLLAVLLPCAPALTGISARAQATNAQAAPSTAALPMTDAQGRSVEGVVCDNLPGTPPAQRSRLYLALTPALRDQTLSLTLSYMVGRGRRQSELRPTNGSAGQIVRDGDQLIYTPPDEFNVNPTPQRLGDITRDPRRTVLLTVTRNGATSATPLVRQTIVLARPPVVMVHGINSDAASPNWNGKDLLTGTLARYGAIALVNHGKDDFSHRHPLTRPALYFKGNGPVEHAAQRVGETVEQALQAARSQHLAIRRVDLIGYSYGGVVARWYLHSFRHDPRSRNSVAWYGRSQNSGRPNPLYQIKPDWYQQQLGGERGKRDTFSFPFSPFSSPECPVRKFVTVASLWRGSPLCNYANEIHAPDASGPRLRQAPLLLGLFGTVGRFVDGPLSEYLATRVPSMEVMAVNSPWLTAMDNYQEDGQEKPCLDNVAYGCVAGDDSAYLGIPGLAEGLFDPYSAIQSAQTPAWFPYLVLERRADSLQNYSDGLVPLWSAIITQDFGAWHHCLIVGANHDSILANPQAQAFVVCALNNRAWLPPGSAINPRFRYPIVSRELLPLPDVNAPGNLPIPAFAIDPPNTAYTPDRPRKTWYFRAGGMAPDMQNEYYPQINMLARIAPAALREIRDLKVDRITRTSAVVSWHTAGELSDTVTVTQWQQVNFARYEDVEAACEQKPLGPRVTRDHQILLTGLLPGTRYNVVVSSEAYDDTGVIASVRSDRQPFTTRP